MEEKTEEKKGTSMYVQKETLEKLKKYKGYNGCVSIEDVLYYLMDFEDKYNETNKIP